MENQKKQSNKQNSNLLSQSIETSEMTSNPYPTKISLKKNEKITKNLVKFLESPKIDYVLIHSGSL